MHSPIQLLNEAGVTFFPPATMAQIQVVEDRLGIPVPDEIRACTLITMGSRRVWILFSWRDSRASLN